MDVMSVVIGKPYIYYLFIVWPRLKLSLKDSENGNKNLSTIQVTTEGTVKGFTARVHWLL